MDGPDPDPIVARWRVVEAAGRRRAVSRERELLALELRLDDLWPAWAASDTQIVAHTRAGRVHRGRVVGRGADMVVLAPEGGPAVALRTGDVVAVQGDHHEVAGTTAPPGATTFEDLLGELADRSADVTLVTSGGVTIRGVLEVAGVDTLIVADTTGRRSYLRLDALSEVSSMSITSSSW
jgi:hypothetical protein